MTQAPTLRCSNCRRNACLPPQGINRAIPIWCERCRDDPAWFRLTPGQENVLALLSDGKERTSSEIAKTVFLSEEWTRAVVLELLEKGLLERRKLPRKSSAGHPPYLYKRASHPQDEYGVIPFGEQRGRLSKEEARRG